MTCPSCGAASASGRFCSACGQPLEHDASTGESTSDSDSFDHGRFAPGTRLGERYRIVGRLGVGGMGEVYRADDLKLGQPVALKFLPEEVERDPVRLDKLNTEIRTARQISHPNVCRVYDVGEADGRRFLTMEYVDGEDLRSLLRRIGRLPEDKGVEIARQICAGLAAMHDRGVLHRDLKPANVMLDGRGRVRLTDFGLATTMASADREGEIAGTPAYMAPEQLAGEPLSVASDLYALGAVLYELFTGERLHKTDRLQDARAGRGASATSVALSTSGSGAKLDPMIQRVIERCLEPEPKRRPQSAIVVAAALPGGDPLAAALAAGETPSPQMVAAAGAEGGLSLKIAVPLVVALVIGTFLLAGLRGRGSYLDRVPWPDSPEVLANKAREMLDRLGYTGPVADSATGFVTDQDYVAWLKEHDTSATRWQHVASVRPPIYRFWHRTSPVEMMPLNYFGGTPGGGFAVSRSDPPMIRPGMTYLELDAEGRLISLDAVPGDKIDPPTEATEPDWAALFREAGLDPGAFTPAEPEWVSRAAADATAAWTGPGADATGATVRVEAAALGGRPVFFRLIAPWTQPSTVEASPDSGSDVAAMVILLSILLGVPAAAVGLSLRNLRLGRTDVRGATRLSVVVGLLALVAAVFSSHLPSATSTPLIVFMLGSWGAFMAVLSWTFYAALEPYARRGWPRTLIGWSRLVDGRWRDPLVGRDLLVGGVFSVALGLLSFARTSAFTWAGTPVALALPFREVASQQQAVSLAIAAAGQSVLVALGYVMLLVLFRIALRSERAAAIGVVLLFVGIDLLNPEGTSSVLLSIVFAALASGTLVLVATRFGLLTLAAMMAFGQISASASLVPGFSRGATITLLVLAMAPALFGFYTATRGRQSSGWLDA